jgi:hypothetical protein
VYAIVAPAKLTRVDPAADLVTCLPASLASQSNPAAGLRNARQRRPKPNPHHAAAADAPILRGFSPPLTPSN